MTLGFILFASLAGGTLSAGLAALALALRATWIPMLVSYAIGALLYEALVGKPLERGGQRPSEVVEGVNSQIDDVVVKTVVLLGITGVSAVAAWNLVPDALLSAAWVAVTIRLVYRETDRRIGLAIGRLIAGVSLVDAMVLSANGASYTVIGLAVLCFGLTLVLQRYIEGT